MLFSPYSSQFPLQHTAVIDTLESLHCWCHRSPNPVRLSHSIPGRSPPTLLLVCSSTSSMVDTNWYCSTTLFFSYKSMITSYHWDEASISASAFAWLLKSDCLLGTKILRWNKICSGKGLKIKMISNSYAFGGGPAEFAFSLLLLKRVPKGQPRIWRES